MFSIFERTTIILAVVLWMFTMAFLVGNIYAGTQCPPQQEEQKKVERLA